MALDEAGTSHFRAMHHARDELDYWDGEP